MLVLVFLQSHRHIYIYIYTAYQKINLFSAFLATEVKEQLIPAAVMSPSFKPHTVWAVCVARVILPHPKPMHKLLTVTEIIKDSVFSIVGFGLCPSQLQVWPEHSKLDEPDCPLSSIQLLLLFTNSGYCHRRLCASFLLNYPSNHVDICGLNVVAQKVTLQPIMQ